MSESSKERPGEYSPVNTLIAAGGVQLLADIIEFLPDATFVVDQKKRVVAWNRACEFLTGVNKNSILGKGDLAYSEPFFGIRRPVLIDLLDDPSPEWEALYTHFQRKDGVIYAEFYIPGLKNGQGAYLWGEAVALFDKLGKRCGSIEVVRDVTEQKRVERALRESEHKHRVLFETAGDAILLMRDNFFLDCNSRSLSMFGCSREQLIGMPPYKFSPTKQPNGRSSKEMALEKIEAALSKGPQQFEWEHCRLDESPFAAEVTLNRVELAGNTMLQAIVRDSSERKEIERALQESERSYRELVMLANSIILRWSRDGRITFLNEFGQRFFGYSEEEIVNRHVLGTIVPGDETTGRDLRTLMVEICANPKDFERNINENICSNGERVWIDWTNKVVLDSDGQIREILSIGSDITERKKAEDALAEYRDRLEEQVGERTRQLAAEKERAESADRLKSSFLAAMSHELRTPLNSVIGFTGILLQQIPGPLNEEQQKQLGMVQRSAHHLLALINDVLDISKIEAGQLRVDEISFPVALSAQQVLRSMEHLAAEKELLLRGDISTELTEIIGDPRRYEQVLLNLISNAIKFTEVGEISVSVRPGTDRTVESVVRDTGIGIKMQDQETIFDAFQQLENGTARKHEGTGLGLSVSRRLVELMGGQISVQSEPGVGSTFIFSVPARISEMNKESREAR